MPSPSSRGHADGSVAPSASFEPSSFEGTHRPDQQGEQGIAATDRPRRPPPIGRAPGLDKRVEGAESLGRGNRATQCVLFPLVPANLEPHQTVEPLETDKVSMGVMDSRPWWPGFSAICQLWTVWPEEGGCVVGCKHPGRSQKPHEKRRNCLPHAPMLSRRLVAGARPRSRQMAGMCVGRGPGSRRHPCRPHSPHCMAAGLDAWYLRAAMYWAGVGGCLQVPKLGSAICPRTGGTLPVMDTRSRLALPDDDWAGTEGPSFCAPLCAIRYTLAEQCSASTCISTHAGTEYRTATPGAGPGLGGLGPFLPCLPRSSH